MQATWLITFRGRDAGSSRLVGGWGRTDWYQNVTMVQGALRSDGNSQGIESVGK
jgi:hypothetical protein